MYMLSDISTCTRMWGYIQYRFWLWLFISLQIKYCCQTTQHFFLLRACWRSYTDIMAIYKQYGILVLKLAILKYTEESFTSWYTTKYCNPNILILLKQIGLFKKWSKTAKSTCGFLPALGTHTPGTTCHVWRSKWTGPLLALPPPLHSQTPCTPWWEHPHNWQASPTG